MHLENQNIFKSKIFALFYRFLKFHNIPIRTDWLYYTFGTWTISIDTMCVAYMENPNVRCAIQDSNINNIFDYFWNKYLFENYDEINKYKNNFILINKEGIKDIISQTHGKDRLENLAISIKKRYNFVDILPHIKLV